MVTGYVLSYFLIGWSSMALLHQQATQYYQALLLLVLGAFCHEFVQRSAVGLNLLWRHFRSLLQRCKLSTLRLLTLSNCCSCELCLGGYSANNIGKNCSTHCAATLLQSAQAQHTQTATLIRYDDVTQALCAVSGVAALLRGSYW